MPFYCDEATRERLEWTRLAECLARESATLRGAEACRGGLFAATRAEARDRLAETDEGRTLLDAGEELPLGGVRDLRPQGLALARGALLQASELADVLGTLRASIRLRAFLSARIERAPRLAARAETLPDLRALEKTLASAITPEGELRDDATPELARAMRRTRDLEAEVQERMSALLRSPAIQPYLQDHYVTLRENRPVLPVRADSRQHVPGLVHDVSASGTTVFVEPESVVELSNRLRMARSELEREIERVLRQLSAEVGAHAAELEALGVGLEELDVAHARARLSRAIAASNPDTRDDAPLALRELRHPLLLLEAGLARHEVIANDVELPPGARGLVISGPNAGGKTVAAKAVGLAALSLRAGLHVSCAEGSRIPLFDRVCADIGDEQDLRSGLSTFSARMTNLARIVESAEPGTLVIVDEIGEGTEPAEGASLAQAILEDLVSRGAFVLATTHFNRLKELAGSDERFVNASAEFDANTLLPTYRLRLGFPGSSGAIWVAQRMGLDDAVTERARALLDGEDRKLEALTRNLSELRQELEAERQSAVRIREETEGVRREYEARLGSLRVAREKALAAMKADLEAAFRSAQAEVAEVMRSLQRGSGTDGRAANLAREELEEIRERTEQVEQENREPAAPAEIDPARLVVGARLRLEGASDAAILLEPPDRRGKLTVRAGGVRMQVPLARVRAVLEGSAASATPRVTTVLVERATEVDTSPTCDLRGLRVDEALARADAHLQRLLGTGIREIRFIHGHGTGALRAAIRSWLADLPEVESFNAEPQERGGDGVTVVTLSR